MSGTVTVTYTDDVIVEFDKVDKVQTLNNLVILFDGNNKKIFPTSNFYALSIDDKVKVEYII